MTSNDTRLESIKSKIRSIPGWPKQGVVYRDITTLLKDKEGFNQMIDLLAERYKGQHIDLVAGIEARGFIVGGALAHRLGIGFVPIRKKGKLPGKTVSIGYGLEYGKDTIEVHEDAIDGNSHILIVDDLIATGGTALAACQLITKLGGKVVECCFVVDLPDLKGKNKLEDAGFKTFNLIEFEGE